MEKEEESRHLDVIEEIFSHGAKPWERQPGESATAFACFISYRDQKPASRSKKASVDLLADDRGMSVEEAEGSISEMIEKYHWFARVVAWDDLMDQETRQQMANRYDGMAQAHIATARMIQSIVVERLQGMTTSEIESLKPNQIVALLSIAQKMEKEAIESHVNYEEKVNKSSKSDIEILDTVADLAKDDPENQKKLLEIRDQIAAAQDE